MQKELDRLLKATLADKKAFSHRENELLNKLNS